MPANINFPSTYHILNHRSIRFSCQCRIPTLVSPMGLTIDFLSVHFAHIPQGPLGPSLVCVCVCALDCVVYVSFRNTDWLRLHTFHWKTEEPICSRISFIINFYFSIWFWYEKTFYGDGLNFTVYWRSRTHYTQPRACFIADFFSSFSTCLFAKRTSFDY